MQNGDIVGFGRTDADLLIGMIEGAGGQHLVQSLQRRGFKPKFGRTKPAGLPANGTGMVFVQVPTATGWEDSYEILAWNRGAAVDGNKAVLLIEIDGRICVHDRGEGGGVEGTAFVLTSVPAFGAFNAIATATATILNPDGSVGSAIVVKCVGRVRGRIGSRGFAVMQNGEWIVVEIQQPAAHILASLKSKLNPDTLTVDVIPSKVYTQWPNDITPPLTTPEEGPDYLNVDNPKRLCGFVDAKVDLTYDAIADRYFIESIDRQAFRVKGKVYGDFGEGDSDVTLHYVEGIDGYLNEAIRTAGEVEAKNSHKWAASTDATARAEYNWAAEQWELYQVDCDVPEEEPEEE